MNDIEYLNEFYKHIGTDSILVVTKNGEIIRLFCPFEAVAKVSFPDIAAGEFVAVQEVRITPQLKDIFIIAGKAYFSTFFLIVVDNKSNISVLTGMI